MEAETVERAATPAAASGRGKLPDLSIPLSIFGGALLLRALAMLLAFDPDVRFEKFFLLAERLITERWLPGEPFSFAPAYVYFIAILIRLGASPAAICLVQMVLGALTCVVIWDLTRRLFGTLEGTLAGIWAAVLGPFLIYTIAFESDLLGLFLFCAMALAIVAATQQPSAWRFVLAGLLLGLRAAQRPNVLLVVPLLLVVWWLCRRQTWGARRAAALSAAFCVAAVAIVGPITWWNHRTGGGFMPVVSSGGWVFYTSNNYQATGLSYYPPPLALELARAPLAEGEDELSRLDDTVSRRVAGIATGREMSAAESSRFWLREGVLSIERRGLRQIALQAKKLYYMFHGYEGHDNLSLLLKEEKLGWLIAMGMGALAPFGLVGFALAYRAGRFRAAEPWVVSALLLGSMISMSIFYVGPRFRLEFEAMLIPFAAFGLARLLGRLRERRLRAAATMAAALVIIAVIVNLPGSGVRQQQRSRSIQLQTFLGERAAGEGEAARAFARAVDEAEYPAEAEAAHLSLARIYLARGDAAAAERHEAIARGVLPPGELQRLSARRRDADALWAVGRHYMLSGEYGKAATEFADAARLAPDDPDILFSRAVASFEARSAPPEEIASWTEEALRIGLRFSPNAVPAHVLAGKCYLLKGERERAEAALAQALRRAPENEAARALMSRIRGATAPQ